MAEIPLLLLAAGSSTRMGQPKPLLPWGSKTLIEYQIRTLLKTGQPVLVVLGSNADIIVPVIENSGVDIVVNSQWENGMGSSIATGINELTRSFPESAGALIALLDQPLVTTAHLEKMLQTFQPGHRQIIVSRSSSGWQGVPVLFDKSYFEQLKKLNGTTGAKSIVQQHLNAVVTVECGDMLEDMDTPESYQRLREGSSGEF